MAEQIPAARWVLDTHVLISRLLMPAGTVGAAFDIAARRGSFLMSPATLGEISEVIMRPKFDRFIAKPVRREFLGRLAALVEIVHPSRAVRACRDPKDDKFLEVAVHGQATAILTGDADLLVLHPFQSIPILSPQDFVAQFGKPAS